MVDFSRKSTDGRTVLQPTYLVMTIDASKRGWGAHCLGRIIQGRWNQSEKVNSIHWLELWVIRLALIAFQELLERKTVLVCTDNMTAKAHIC